MRAVCSAHTAGAWFGVSSKTKMNVQMKNKRTFPLAAFRAFVLYSQQSGWSYTEPAVIVVVVVVGSKLCEFSCARGCPFS